MGNKKSEQENLMKKVEEFYDKERDEIISNNLSSDAFAYAGQVLRDFGYLLEHFNVFN